MKRIAIIGVVLAFVFGFLAWWFASVQIVKRQTESLLHTLTLEPRKPQTSRRLGVFKFNALLADEVALELAGIADGNGSFDRSDMESAYSALCEHAIQTRFELQEFQSVSVVGDEADVVFSLQALVEFPSSRPVDGRYIVTYHWQHGKHGWQLTHANCVEDPQ